MWPYLETSQEGCSGPQILVAPHSGRPPDCRDERHESENFSGGSISSISIFIQPFIVFSTQIVGKRDFGAHSTTVLLVVPNKEQYLKKYAIKIFFFVSIEVIYRLAYP